MIPKVQKEPEFYAAAFLIKEIIYFSNDTGFVSPVANAFGPGSDMEKYMRAALVVPKSRLEPEFCTLLKASRNI